MMDGHPKFEHPLAMWIAALAISLVLLFVLIVKLTTVLLWVALAGAVYLLGYAAYEGFRQHCRRFAWRMVLLLAVIAGGITVWALLRSI